MVPRFSNLGLTVPDYAQMVGISILPAYHEEINNKIIGIEPEAGEMGIVKRDVMARYHLYGQLNLTASSTPNMLKELGQSIQKEQSIVTTLYQPHWAFTIYPIRYLKDPFGTISKQEERIYSIVRKNLKKEKPDAYNFLDSISSHGIS